MSKKLLSEAQIRRFQSLASIQPLQEMYNEEEPMEELAYSEGEYKEGEHAEGMHTEGSYMEEPMEDMLEEEDDMDADMDDDGDADVELDEELVERFMDAAKAIQEMADALGAEAGMAADPMGDMADAPEPPMDPAPADEPDDAPKGDEDEEDILQEALNGVNYVPSKEEGVSEVAKRVAKRIMEAKEAQAKLNRALGKN